MTTAVATTNEAGGVLTAKPLHHQQPRIIKVVRVTNSDVINSAQQRRRKMLSINQNGGGKFVVPVKPTTRPSLAARPLIGRRRLIRMSDSVNGGGGGRRIIRNFQAPPLEKDNADDFHDNVPEAAATNVAAVNRERTKIIFVSNSKTARASAVSSRPRRRNRKQQQQQQQNNDNNNKQAETMTSQRREFDIENDKLTAAWHSLVNSVTKSNPAMTSHVDNDVTGQLFEFSVQQNRAANAATNSDDVIVCNPTTTATRHDADDVITTSHPVAATRPASGEKRSAVCSLTSSTASSPNASDVDDDVIVTDDVDAAATTEQQQRRRSGNSEKSSGFFKFRGRKILRKDDHVTTTGGGVVGNKLVSMTTAPSNNNNLIPHKPTTAKGDVLPMKLRAFPSSFWEQPNDVTTYDVLPPVQPLFKNHAAGDDVTNIRPVTPPDGRIINRRRKEIVKVADDSSNLLMKLFDSVEQKTNRQTGIRTRRGRPRKATTIAATSTKQQQQHQQEDNPCIIESITEKLLYKLTIDHPHTLLSPLTADDVINAADDAHNASLRHNMMTSLPQLSNVSNEGFSLLLSEVAAVL